MVRRVALLALALALGAAVVGGLSTLPACYDEPRPVCGFRCGPAGACPSGYACNADDGVCHLEGSAPAVCAGVDAGVDAVVDGSIDAPPDAPP